MHALAARLIGIKEIQGAIQGHATLSALLRGTPADTPADAAGATEAPSASPLAAPKRKRRAGPAPPQQVRHVRARGSTAGELPTADLVPPLPLPCVLLVDGLPCSGQDTLLRILRAACGPVQVRLNATPLRAGSN